jgi:hypothetical protein
LKIDTARNWRIDGIRQKNLFFFLGIVHFNEFQISRILLSPMKRTEVIVKAASRKPK